MVPGQVRGDAAYLLIPGQRQERRGAPVGLHPRQEEPVLGVGELGRTVRIDGSARVLVGVDERGQLHRRLEGGVQTQTHLGQQGQVGAEPGQRHHLVHRLRLGAVLAHQDQAVLHRSNLGGTEPGHHLDVSGLDGRTGPPAERTPRGEPVGRAPAEGVPDLAATQHPQHLRPRSLLGQPGQGHQRRQRRVPAPDHGGAPSRIADPSFLIAQVGDPVGDPLGRGGFAQGGQAVTAHRVGAAPGAGGVHDRPGQQPLFAFTSAHPHGEGLLGASGVHDPVPAEPAHPGHLRTETHPVAEGLGQGSEVVLDPLTSGRVPAAVRVPPSRGGEQLLRGRVDQVAPHREQPHVPPLGDRRPGMVTLLQDQGRKVTGPQFRRGRQSHGAGSDHHHGMSVVHDSPLSSTVVYETGLYRCSSMDATIDRRR